MYTLKSIAQRGTMLGAAVALVAAAVIPSVSVMAAELNPLTERSLLLSSSAPGWQDTDGSGFSETSPNPKGEYYAEPGSGPNGKKTGETFSFRVSTDSAATSNPIRAFTLQYCTTAAGLCQAPGDNAGDNRTSDRLANTGVGGGHEAQTSDLEAVLGAAAYGTDYTITVNGAPATATDWAIAVDNAEDDGFLPFGSNDGSLTGKDNFITLTSATGITPAFNDRIEIKFNASSTNYITNPGSGAFFVKMNTYNSASTQDASTTIDGGVTVANVMTDSIHITTKVLETMSFSVGTRNPDTTNVQHGSCDAMTAVNNNRLDLGNPNAENSLETTQAFDAFSYWRLSSNSSGGATVYYSGDTLKSTVGDAIATMGNTVNQTPARSQPGTEQFGLSLMAATGSEDVMDTAHVDGFPSNWVTPALFPLNPVAHYNGGGYDGGGVKYPISSATTSENGQFYFNADSRHTPELIAQNNDQVLSCATSKMRYVANIAADTPAGVYTTKINYLAAPQY